MTFSFPEDTRDGSQIINVMKAVQTPSPLADFKESLISIREALDVLGGKWKIPIMIALAGGDKRFKQIQAHVTGITSKVLSRELKKLEENNLITRIVDAKTKVAVYSLTNKCKSLEKVIDGLKEWGDYHRTNIFNRPIKTTPIIMSSLMEERERKAG